jgi:tetratricopeptide (TPR) repeat protein
MLGLVVGLPDSWTAILRARLALAENDTAGIDSTINVGLALCQRIISVIPGEARGYVNSGYLLMLRHDYESSFQEFQLASFVDNRPYYKALAWLGMGRLYDLQENYALAQPYYEKVLELNSGKYLDSLAEKYLNDPFKLR